MNIKTIGEHSIAVDILMSGVVIDVGCRGFAFSEGLRDLGCEVWAFDMEDFETPEGVAYKKLAISNWTGSGFFKDTLDPQAKYLVTGAGIPVDILSINELYRELINKGKVIDVLKLDCEGEEYRILSDPNFQPIPRQITVEFHEHAHKALHDQYFQACMDNLLKHYVAVKHDRYAAHGAGMNYWDSLFIRRDLL